MIPINERYNLLRSLHCLDTLPTSIFHRHQFILAAMMADRSRENYTHHHWQLIISTIHLVPDWLNLSRQDWLTMFRITEQSWSNQDFKQENCGSATISHRESVPTKYQQFQSKSTISSQPCLLSYNISIRKCPQVSNNNRPSKRFQCILVMPWLLWRQSRPAIWFVIWGIN